MSDNRITQHPILAPLEPATVQFTFNGKPVLGRPGEMVSSALFAAGISVFGHHHRDGGAQGIFCANGQCSQCNVLVEGAMAKSCMTQVSPGLKVESCEGKAPLPEDMERLDAQRPGEEQVEVLVLGGGPAGLCAALELAKVGIQVLIVDDKPALGGKLTLQTHGFFGSVADCWAGTRGIDIGTMLAEDVQENPNIKVLPSTTALGIFRDGAVGLATPAGYRLVRPASLVIAMGAREKALSFPGCDLVGVYGAGAFQTLVNQDLVKPSRKLFILGGGNVGLIGAYHALQAGIDVVGLVEALPECGGYKVHADKIKRMGIPIHTRHTVLKAAGEERLERVTIAQVDERFQPIPGTEKTFEADTLLIAVGLSPVDEILQKAREYGIKTHAAGDSEEVAEASAAIFSGRIVGRRLARELGVPVEIPKHWEPLAEILRARPGKTVEFEAPKVDAKVYPVIRCVQEIPCNPCSASCPDNLIKMEPGIMDLPVFEGHCLGCARCVAVCPALAIVLVDERYDPTGEKVLLTMPHEFIDDQTPLGREVVTTDFDGEVVGKGVVVALREREDQDRRRLLQVEVPFEDRHKVAGFLLREPSVEIDAETLEDEADPIICRCERVRKSEIVREIRAGVRDINQLKALSRPSMGACGGKTCVELVKRIFREEGITLDEVAEGTIRPLTAEMPLGLFAEGKKKNND